jgi:hypothetical protein
MSVNHPLNIMVENGIFSVSFYGVFLLVTANDWKDCIFGDHTFAGMHITSEAASFYF